MSFKSTALVATAVNKRRTGRKRTSWAKKRSSSKLSSLDSYVYEESVPIQTLAAEGRLDQLKSMIKEHDLTLNETDNNGCTLLHHAALHNQLLVMSFLIDSGISLNAVDNDENTALHLAAENDFPEACHLLLSNGASDLILNKKQWTALHLAAQRSNKALNGILDHPVDYAPKGYRSRTPLHVICEHDNIEGMEIFYNKVIVDVFNTKKGGLKICAADDSGLTPLHLAARKNSHRCLDFIIQKATMLGNTTEQVLGFIDEENSTPLHAAVDSCNNETVEVLLKHGASPIISRGSLIPPLHLACSQGRSAMVRMMVKHAGPEIIAHTDQQKKTPLHHCALSIHSSCMIPFLIERGKAVISIDAQDIKGRTPLHSAASSANLAGTKELLSYGANPLVKDNKGLNVLHLALTRNRKVIVSALLELPCAPDMIRHTCCKGYSAIHHALYVGHSEVIPKMLAALQFEIQKAKDEEGNNYLHLAAGKGNVKALKSLLNVPEVHKMLNEPNDSGETPLHAAASGGHSRCIDLLLNNGAMFHKALNGETAFMITCTKGFTECAKLLLQAHPCQICITDDQGNTPLHAAAQSKTPSLITLLLDKKAKIALNSDTLSFFDIIIDSAEYDCAMAVVSHDRWQECLDFGTPTRPSLIISLIEQMPKVAKAVFDRCHSKATNLDKSHKDYWESFDFKYLYHHKPKKSAIRLGLKQAINGTVHPEQDQATATTVKYKDNPKRVSATSMDVTRKKEVCYGHDTMNVLQKMKRFKRQALLTHPVVSAFLESKWKKYGNILYFFQYIFQVLTVLLLSAFVLVVPNPLLEQHKNTTDTNSIGPLMDPDWEPPPLRIEAQVLRALILLAELGFTILIIFSTVILFRRRGGISVLFQVSLWIDVIALFINCFFFLHPNPLTIWPVAAAACFFSWFSLLLSLEHSSIPGTIVKMFLEVTKTVFLVLFISLSLILAFAFSFYILAGSLREFYNVGYAFFSVFGFMLGELPYDMYVRLEVTGELPYGDVILVFILFLAILLSIVLANLLIGLAVGDIERVKLNAILQRKAIEIEFFSQMDASIPKRYLKRFSLPSYKVYPNRNRSLYKIWRDSWKWIEAQIDSDQEDGTTNNTNVAACMSEISELKQHILELKDTLQQMQEANATFHRRYRSLSARSSLSSFDFDVGDELSESYVSETY